MNTGLKNEQTDRLSWKASVKTYSTPLPSPSSPKNNRRPSTKAPSPIPTSDQILVRSAAPGILFRVEESMIKFVLDTLTTQHKLVNNHLMSAVK